MGSAPASHHPAPARSRALSAEITGAYRDWIEWLERFALGHDGPLPSRALGDGDGVATIQRFATSCSGSLNARLGLWNKRLMRAMDTSSARSSSEAEAILRRAWVHGRDELRPVVAFSRSPLLPGLIRDALHASLRSAVENMQRDAELAARREGPAGDRKLRILLETPLTGAFVDRPAAPTTEPPTSGSARRILFNQERTS